MVGTSSVTSTNYTTVSKVQDFLHFYSEVPRTLDATGNIVGQESVGTGNATRTRWALSNRNAVAGTDYVYIGTTATTAYTIDEDAGLITFASAPAASAITAAYKYSDITSSSVADYVLRAEDEIDRRAGRSFKNNQSALQFYDGTSKNFTNVFTYQAFRFVDDVYKFTPQTHEPTDEKYITLKNYPVQSVGLVAINEFIDQKYVETNQDGTVGFGLTTRVSQSFKAGFSKPLDRVSLMLKYNTGTAATITVELQSDSSGVPSGTVLSTTTVSALSSTSLSFYDAVFTSPYTTTANTTYHVVVYSASSTSTSTYLLGADTTSPSYASGSITTSTNGGSTWTADTSKCLIFNTYAADNIATHDMFRYDADTGRVVLTDDSGLKMTGGLQNIVVSYTYGYASVPKVVEDLATKMASLYCIESTLLGRTTPMNIPEGNIGQLRTEIKRGLEALGERIEIRIV